MMPAEVWLRKHVPNAPAQLLETMIASLPDEEESLPDALASAAVRLYAQVVAGDGGREDSLPLLAADALLTHAFQAQAQLDPSGLAALADRWSARQKLAEVPL